jgi:hypothetical protein
LAWSIESSYLAIAVLPAPLRPILCEQTGCGYQDYTDHNHIQVIFFHSALLSILA